MCTVLTRRFPNLEIRLYPVKVQGPGAKEEIVEGIGYFNRISADWIPDVLIVGRGGGSIEDLRAFNEECVVRAVAASSAEARLLRSAQRLLPALKDAVVESERCLLRLDQRLLPALKDSFSKNERRIATVSAKLDLLDPANPLKRGYSLSLDAKGAIVRSISSVKPGDRLTTRLANGELDSIVSA